MKVDGGCHCGKIRYEAEVDPDKVLICHCTDCQTLSGSAFRTGGAEQQRQLQAPCRHPQGLLKTAESSRRRVRTFCADGATPIYSAVGDGNTKIVVPRVAAIRQRDLLIPSYQ